MTDRRERERRQEERYNATSLIQFFRGPMLPIALGLFLLPPLMGLLGILSAYLR